MTGDLTYTLSLDFLNQDIARYMSADGQITLTIPREHWEPRRLTLVEFRPTMPDPFA